jgi:Cytochrome c7 and related cytochrome c/Cytochrome c554 and c-prime
MRSSKPDSETTPRGKGAPGEQRSDPPPHAFIPFRRRLLLVALCLSAAVGSVAAQGPFSNRVPTDNFCTVCHSDKQVELQDSAHAREGVKCADCHGGDAKAQTVARAHSNNFKGTFDRKQAVELCASCHSDQAKMKPYGIPTDQFALYRTSGHGQKWMLGDTRVAVCTDCHGTHQILPADNPKSPVYQGNIPQTCGRCHANADTMKPYGLDPNIVDAYRSSVHGQGLLERHNRQAPECTRCHGTHGAAPPGIGNVATVCGQCHTKTLEAFRHSPHKTTMEVGKQSECASCHSNHAIAPASHEMWGTSCASCHESGSPEADRGTKIQTLFLQAEKELENAHGAIEGAKRIPLDVSDYETRLSDARTYLVEARPVSHDFSVDDVEDLTRRARSIALEVESELHQKMGVFRGRTIVLLLVLFYILISIGVVTGFRRRLEAKRDNAN